MDFRWLLVPILACLLEPFIHEHRTAIQVGDEIVLIRIEFRVLLVQDAGDDHLENFRIFENAIDEIIPLGATDLDIIVETPLGLRQNPLLRLNQSLIELTQPHCPLELADNYRRQFWWASVFDLEIRFGRTNPPKGDDK